MAVFLAGQANALDSTSASRDAGGAQKTRPFGKLSLSLSLTLSVPVGKSVPLAKTLSVSDVQLGESTTKAKTLGELNAEIAAIEEMIKVRQRQLEKNPENPLPPIHSSLPPSSSPSHELTNPVEAVSDESLQGSVIASASSVAGVASGVLVANIQPSVFAPNARPSSTKKATPVEFPGLGLVDWTIALAVPLIAAFLLIWYRRRKAGHIGKPNKTRGAGQPHKEPKIAPLQEVFVAPPSAVEQTLKMPADVVPPQKQQSILPPEYEMLEEADIYLRFGHDKLAEEALREAIRINPHNPQAYLTLLRIYFSREDSASFLVLARELKSLGEGSVWPRVAEMGRNLDSDNPLYR